MHVAVCDDNVADRKQMERLLGRESDRRAKLTEGLYIDSYGNEKALLRNPMQYDIFYIDMCKTEGITGTQVADKLLEIGVQVPVYMCCSDTDYRKEKFAGNVFFIDKPIKVEQLIASLDHAYEQKQNAIPRIELRDETSTQTLYIEAADIMYGTFSKRHVSVRLTDGRIMNIASDIENLYGQWAHHQTFVIASPKSIVNVRHIDRVGFLHVYMKDGARFPVQSIAKEQIKALTHKNQ